MHDRQGYKLDRQANPDAARPGAQKFRVVNVGDDYLDCNPYRSDGTVNSSSHVYLMKPYSLRRTPFDGTGPDTGGVSYVYSSDVARVGTLSTITESQRITPDYNDGDIVYGELGAEAFTLTNGKTTRWVDVNRDARAWAHLEGS